MLVKKTVEETIEISLPFFSLKDSGYMKNYYAIHEGTSFEILISETVCYVSIVNNPEKIMEAVKHDPITEMDFDFAYALAIDRLKKSVLTSKPECLGEVE